MEEKGSRKKNKSGETIRINRQNVYAGAFGQSHFAYDLVYG